MRLALPSRANRSDSDDMNENIVKLTERAQNTMPPMMMTSARFWSVHSLMAMVMCNVLLTVYTLYADTPPPVYFMFLLSESFYITSVSGLQ